MLAVVRAIRAQAERAGLAGDPVAVAVPDERAWSRAYRGEAGRRADGTRAAVRAEQARAVLERMRPGRPLAEEADPFALEVHHAIDSRTAGLPVLPAYVPREHDHLPAEAVTRAAAGADGIAVLVGGSSTGKARACWEALHLLREREEGRRLWHPVDPSPPGAASAELGYLAPYTVLWLNEAQEYLTPAPHGEELAASLRTALRDPRRAPVLVPATGGQPCARGALGAWRAVRLRTRLRAELWEGRFVGEVLGSSPGIAECGNRGARGGVEHVVQGRVVPCRRGGAASSRRGRCMRSTAVPDRGGDEERHHQGGGKQVASHDGHRTRHVRAAFACRMWFRATVREPARVIDG
ncbi:hypothetical protein [Embleya sp. MST-111070]|uniref:hypothetical protein n=1 Tax=Embleya sp. MST-111070 TaxID=3398231 RepID=UPI003F734FE1